MGNKVKDFLKALDEGKTKEEAQEISGVADATAKIQHKKWSGEWKKGAKTEPEGEVTTGSTEEEEIKIVNEEE